MCVTCSGSGGTGCYDQVEKGEFPVVRCGRQLRFRRSDIERYVLDNYHGVRAGAT